MKKQLGQFFTTNEKVQQIFQSLIKNQTGTLLEPAVGRGDLLSLIDLNRHLVLFELDDLLKKEWNDNVKKSKTKEYFNQCFFKIKNIKPTTIISNPPYVKKSEYSKFMSSEMKEFINDEKYEGKFNLAYIFMHKCAQLLENKGEMIFIVPKDFTYSTSGLILRKYLEENGSFSDWIDCGEEKIFKDASLETLTIFRWQKKIFSKNVKTFKSLNDFLENKVELKECLYYGDNKNLYFVEVGLSSILKTFSPLSSSFAVCVGSVSGLDEVFKVEKDFINNENKYFVDLFTTGAGKKEYFINTLDVKEFEDLPQSIQNHLNKHKDKLLSRYGVKDHTWWKWSFLRNANVSLKNVKRDRIYTFSKTRSAEPFEVGDYNGFVGSTYALFPINKKVNLKKIVELLNSDFYKKIYASSGLAVSNKFQATPSAIKDIPLPSMDKISEILDILKKEDYLECLKNLNKK
jgi:adenine-specific DNA-methyltransferase